MYKKLLFAAAILILSPLCAFSISEDKIKIETAFFDGFNDDNLSRYIGEAYYNNHTLKQMTAKVDQYKYAMKYQFGSELPTISASANYTGIHTPEISNFKLSKSAFALPFMANYEADFLLKNRDKTRSAKKAFEAEELNKKTAYISLLSDVATVYSNILQYDKLIENQTKILEIADELFNINKRKFARGVIDLTSLNNSENYYLSARNQLENYQNERDTLLLNLAVLTANPIKGDMARGKLENFEYNGSIPGEIQSDVIFARPDVLAAEKNLEKAKIDVRVARKEFLPTFNITGVWAFNTLAPGTFFSWESSLAMLIAGATQDIFAGGKKVANLKMQKAKYEELFENYRQVDLEATKEVNTALCIIKHKTKVDENNISKLSIENKNYQDAREKFDRGVISKSDFLQAELKLLAAENEAINSKTERIVNYFTLYKAVGGQL